MKGKLIVLEGIDGAGTETQSKLLLDYLKKKGIQAERIRYPDYEQPLGRLIHEYLHKKYDFSAESQVMLYAADMVKDKERIKKWLGEGRTVVLDRYITSTMAYQGFAGFPVERILSLAELFGLPRPDTIFYLKVSAKTSMERKYKEKSELDRNEENKALLEKLGVFYEKLAKKSTFGRWVVIDGEKTKEEVFGEIRKELGL